MKYDDPPRSPHLGGMLPRYGLNRREFVTLMATALGGLAVGPIETISITPPAGLSNDSLMPTVKFCLGPAWPSELGNVRALVAVPKGGGTVRVRIPWRRRDRDPQNKAILVREAATGKMVENVAPISITRDYGDIAVELASSPGLYEIYYMPYSVSPVSWAYSVGYRHPQQVSDTAWLERSRLTPELLKAGQWRALPQASVSEIQARTDFDRFDPMELVATQEETNKLVALHAGAPFLLFPEERQFPIRMTGDLPLRWVVNGPRTQVHGEAERGEFFVFQVGVYACQRAVENLLVECTDLKSNGSGVIPAEAMTCFNLSGTDWLGRSIRKDFSVPQGKIGALWFGVQISKDTPPGNYRGSLTVCAEGQNRIALPVNLMVSSHLCDDAGDSELWRHSRLRWLNSTLGIDDEVTVPYTPMTVQGRTVGCLGREVCLGTAGLPASLRSNGREILARPINFVVDTDGGETHWSGGEVEPRKIAPGAVTWDARNSAKEFTLQCRARMEFDGHISFDLHLRAPADAHVNDICLEIPFRKDAAIYMMGLARKGGYRPTEWKWSWDVNRAINTVWMGDYNAGLQLKLKGKEDTWDIYDLKAGGIPSAWGNDGKGGCTVTEEGEKVLLRAFTGERHLNAGEELLFRFSLLITPVKPLDRAHWSQRYYHILGSPEDAVKCGASIINIHQGNELNPYINYPFLTVDKLSAYVNDAHGFGLKVKIYYTVRELSNHVAEMWALRSLGDEIFVDGPGGGGAWLREHLAAGYVPAWHETLATGEVDAAIATAGLSRWHNYYLEGLAWLLRNVEIDGLYLDGIGYDRQIMKRVRKVLDRNRPGSLIDFHSGNEFPFHDLRISPANKYMEHFPYLNSLWFGEMYDYNESPDYWLVEISGIPFGLFSEMLQDNGNPWRGMVYGMTARYYQSADPKHIWKLWDDFGIQDAEMLGYWVPSCPVRTSRQDVLATVYKKDRRSLISIASWAPEAVQCRLSIDWAVLGLSAETAKLSAPAIEGFQDAASFSPSSAIPVEPGKGWLLMLEESA